MTAAQNNLFIVEQLVRITAIEVRYLERIVNRLRKMNIDLAWVGWATVLSLPDMTVFKCKANLSCNRKALIKGASEMSGIKNMPDLHD